MLGAQPVTVTLPVVAEITGNLTFPAVDTAATITLGATPTAPAGVTPLSRRRAQSAMTLTVYEYVSMKSATTVHLPNIPAMTYTLPASAPVAGKSFSYGISDIDSQGGQLGFNTHGPGTISGRTVSFAPVPTPLLLEAGHTYTFMLYATATVAPAAHIYVANYDSSTIATYNRNGSRTTPTITAGIQQPTALAVDATGKLYVYNAGSTTLTTYAPDGTRISPTITNLNSGEPTSLAVGADGKIYIAQAFSLNVYRADGSVYNGFTPPGLQYSPNGIAVDSAGEIYVSTPPGQYFNDTVFTYDATGNPSTPTITTGLYETAAIAVDGAGKIYVVNRGMLTPPALIQPTVTSYNADGAQTLPTVTAALDGPAGVAVDAADNIYVVNSGNRSVSTYNPDGSVSAAAFLTGLGVPDAIAVH